MFKIHIIDECTKEDLVLDRSYRTKFFARRAIEALAKIDACRAVNSDFPMLCWFSGKTKAKLYLNSGNITWQIEKA